MQLHQPYELRLGRSAWHTGHAARVAAAGPVGLHVPHGQALRVESPGGGHICMRGRGPGGPGWTSEPPSWLCDSVGLHTKPLSALVSSL